MCTSICEIAPIEGQGRTDSGWIGLDTAVVSFDHPRHAPYDDAICIDFFRDGKDAGARVAVELPLESAKALARALNHAIAEADEQEATGAPPLKLKLAKAA